MPPKGLDVKLEPAAMPPTVAHAHLATPPDTPHGHTWRYGVGFPLQIAPGLWTQDASQPLIIGDSSWRIISHGLTTAIPDGGDLLLSVLAGKPDDAQASVGVCRWR